MEVRLFGQAKSTAVWLYGPQVDDSMDDKDQEKTKAKTTISVDVRLWKRFTLKMHEERDITSHSRAVEVAMQEWLDSPDSPPGVSTEPSGEAPPGAGTIDPKHEQYHRMLDTILRSGVGKITEAIVSNLAAFEDFALLVEKETGGGKTNRPRKSGNTALELDRANQEALRSAVELEEATKSDRRGKRSADGKAGAA